MFDVGFTPCVLMIALLVSPVACSPVYLHPATAFATPVFKILCDTCVLTVFLELIYFREIEQFLHCGINKVLLWGKKSLSRYVLPTVF